MKPYQERVVTEKNQLDQRIENLSDFIRDNDLYLDLPEDEQARMTRLLDVMGEYSDILGERIAAFVAS